MKLKETVILFKFKLSTKMKKLFLSLAVVSMSVSFFACGGATEEKKEDAAAKNADSAENVDTTAKTDSICTDSTATTDSTVEVVEAVAVEEVTPAQN